ncbi:PREDICTED: uncharacterized protein LOC104702735 [Camelina sativa]|uniref:Uncharacterized protein LOC104702735 n=1 Tax=Camelina sativa TaxID=90675 RepID=A0ABM0SW13_CAMSA|nr:PREDICTED: uncharacterized protein LOC104702735 [Camelina sativa]
MVEVEYVWLPTNCKNCGQLGHNEKRCLQSTSGHQADVATIIESSIDKVAELGNVNAPGPIQVVTNQLTAPIQISSIEVPITNVSLLHVGEPIATKQASSAIVEEHILPATVSASENISISKTVPATPLSIESPIQETAQLSSAISHATFQGGSSKQAEIKLGSNQFSSLGSSEGEEDLSESELDNETEPIDLMTPTDKRILLERPVKPSTVLKETLTRSGRGRGRGRGKRGGRG